MTQCSPKNKMTGALPHRRAVGLCALVWLIIFGASTAGALQSSTRSLLPSSSVLHPVALVNCGGAAYTDLRTGFTWNANKGKTQNSGSVSTKAWINTTDTTNPRSIYQSARQFRRTAMGPYRMEIPVALSNLTSSSYLVELHFAELQTDRRRIFTVTVQDNVVAYRFEILQAAGNAPFTAVTLATQIPSPESGVVVIEFIPVRYNPIISAIAVYEMVPEPTSTPSLNPTKSPSPSSSTSHNPTKSPGPSLFPSFNPTKSPNPSSFPSLRPTKSPSPSFFPSHNPAKLPSPSFFPSRDPTKTPSPSSVHASQTPASDSIDFLDNGSWIEVATNHSALERRHEACFVWLNGKGKLILLLFMTRTLPKIPPFTLPG